MIERSQNQRYKAPVQCHVSIPEMLPIGPEDHGKSPKFY
jgi:hypothetical protein